MTERVGAGRGNGGGSDGGDGGGGGGGSCVFDGCYALAGHATSSWQHLIQERTALGSEERTANVSVQIA